MGPTWVLSVPDGPHVDPMNIAIRVLLPITHHFARQAGSIHYTSVVLYAYAAWGTGTAMKHKEIYGEGYHGSMFLRSSREKETINVQTENLNVPKFNIQ